MVAVTVTPLSATPPASETMAVTDTVGAGLRTWVFPCMLRATGLVVMVSTTNRWPLRPTAAAWRFRTRPPRAEGLYVPAPSTHWELGMVTPSGGRDLANSW